MANGRRTRRGSPATAGCGYPRQLLLRHERGRGQRWIHVGEWVDGVVQPAIEEQD